MRITHFNIKQSSCIIMRNCCKNRFLILLTCFSVWWSIWQYVYIISISPILDVVTVPERCAGVAPSFDEDLVAARALGVTTEARAASILSKEDKNNISIVISHCDKPIGWMESFIGKGKFQVTDITVISKCDPGSRRCEGTGTVLRSNGNS